MVRNLKITFYKVYSRSSTMGSRFSLKFLKMQNLIETWEINQKMNELLINGITEEYFSDRAISKSRSAGEQLTHLHNVRLMWLAAAMPELLPLQKKFEKEESFSKQTLIEEMKKSSQAISALLKQDFLQEK